MSNVLSSIFFICLPATLRRHLLRRRFGESISANCQVGRSFFDCRNVRMGNNTKVGDFNVFRRLEVLELSESASIGNRNWVTAIPRGKDAPFTESRYPSFILDEHASISSSHYIDCQEKVCIGKFTIVAGQGSQFWTHGIDVVENIQVARPIRIGEYCYLGSRLLVLGGAEIPNCCVIAAGSVVSGKLINSYCLYGGVPAKFVKELPSSAGYFQRHIGFVK